ncbi:MAG TPA: amidohydrolase family protein [Bacillota bacterium]|nr:amidohydrolase family protein [Fastidiosipila sp.]HPX93875.1 amidohydrolase family protein [Bacillota bacterium]HQB81439.1 amidohydrolase family protein [Bacillota bacterium]
MAKERLLVHGDFVFTPNPGEVLVHEDAYMSVEGGRVEAVSDKCPQIGPDVDYADYAGKLIIPGFSDVHLHAVQYVTRGLGYDKELLPWLEDYTFPEESNFKKHAYGETVFRDLVQDLWSAGTLHCAIYSSLHTDAALLLMDLFAKAGLSAYVGKVNMDRNSVAVLQETTEESIRETMRYLRGSEKYAADDVRPILTPRFAPSCTDELLHWLGEQAHEHGLPVQSHVNENLGEVAWVKELFPKSRDYLSVYQDFNLLPKSRTIMAHCIHNTEAEMKMFADKDVLIAHCPDSNGNLASGIMPAGEMLDSGLRVGLGSDIGGGNRLFIGHAVESAMRASRLLWAQSDHAYRTLTFTEAFHMATAGGGSFFGQTGAFLPGFSFDALVIDDSKVRKYRPLSVFERLQKFIFTGDDRNIKIRYRAGRVLEEPVFD